MDFRQTGLMKINFLHAPRILLCALIILSAIIFSGCFMADNKFYRDSDIITDSHFVGKFRRADSITNIQSSTASLTIEAGNNKHYIGTYHEGEDWIKLDTVLFQLGTNTYVDIHRLDDSGESHDSKEYKAFVLIRGLLLDCPHCAIRVVVKDNQIEPRISPSGFLPMIGGTSEMKTSPMLKFPKLSKFIGSTEELRSFLIIHGSDGDDNKKNMVEWIRSEK
jgi:hypothetical protein